MKKDLLGIADLSDEEIHLVLDTTEAMREIGQRPIKKVPTLRGKTVVNLFFENEVVGHLTGSYDANPGHNLERCEVMGTEGRFVLDNLYEELTFYPRRSNELTVIIP